MAVECKVMAFERGIEIHRIFADGRSAFEQEAAFRKEEGVHQYIFSFPVGTGLFELEGGDFGPGSHGGISHKHTAELMPERVYELLLISCKKYSDVIFPVLADALLNGPEVSFGTCRLSVTEVGPPYVNAVSMEGLQMPGIKRFDNG